MFDNMVAIENRDYFGKRGKQGLSNNFLVSLDSAKMLCINSWTKLVRLNKDSVAARIKQADLKGRMIAISYHKSSELSDCYEHYTSLERAIELIEDESLFVFKFRVLSDAVTAEYKMIYA